LAYPLGSTRVPLSAHIVQPALEQFEGAGLGRLRRHVGSSSFLPPTSESQLEIEGNPFPRARAKSQAADLAA